MKHCLVLLLLVTSFASRGWCQWEPKEKWVKYLPKGLEKYREAQFYSQATIPKAYQFNDRIADPKYNVSATQPPNGIEPFGNANREFPWIGTAGMDQTVKTKVINFVVFPPGSKIKWERKVLPGELGDASGYKVGTYVWYYPNDTVFGEVLINTELDRTFEVRTRTKVNGKWHGNVFRPFSNRVEYVVALVGEGIQVSEPTSRQTVRFEDTFKSLVKGHRKPAINRRGTVDVLPPIPRDVVLRFLNREFKSVHGEIWCGQDCYAPTANDTGNIFPKGYRAETLAVNQKDCMTCHEGVLKHANDFTFVERDWYGRVRGSDGIFTWHPFDPGCINRGYSQMPQFRESLRNLLQRK